MQKYHMIHKNLGETPLQALERLREGEKLGSDVKMTYAGRLDPLAEGQLLILVGEECKKKDEYLGLDKEYEVEILLGVSTDTGDVMGVVNKQAKTAKQGKVNCKAREGALVHFAVLAEDKTEIDRILKSFVGKITWPYPAFSSKTVQGKPLFLWALEDRLDEIDIMPVRESEIYELELLSGKATKKMSVSELREQVHQKINSIAPVQENIVKGKDTKRLGKDFRREAVLASWAGFFEQVARETLTSGPLATMPKLEVIKIRCKCASGTYMRTLAQKIGDELGMPALALSIVRTKIMV